MYWWCEQERLTHGKQIPVCRSYVVWEQRGRRDNASLFSNCRREDWCFQWVAGSAHCKIANVLVMWTRAVYPRQTNTYLLIFCYLRVERATKERLPLFQLQTWGLMLPARCWKRSLQHNKCSGDANGSGLPTANKYLFADLLFSTSGEGDEATSPIFTTHYMQLGLPTHRWKRSLQFYCPHVALQKRPLSNGNQPLDCHWIVVFLRKWRVGNAAILCVDWRLQHVVVSMHFSLKARKAFPIHGNTYLPRRARGPLWCPPSGHFFPSLRFISSSRLGYIWVVAPFWIWSQILLFPRLS